METQFLGISAKCQRVHAGIIYGWLRRWAAGEAGPHFTLALCAPLGPVSVMVAPAATVEFPRIKVERKWRAYIVQPADERSAELIAAWSERYKDTTLEEFISHPYDLSPALKRGAK